MNSSKYRFTLDMQSDISQISIPVRQWDNNRELLINLTDSGSPYIIGKGCYAFLAATNNDNEDILLPCTIVKSTIITIVLGNTITKIPGVVDCEIRLFGANNELITSPSFILVVQNRVVSDDSDAVKDEDLPLLNQLMGAEANRVAAEEERVAAEENRQERFEYAMDYANQKINQTISNAMVADGLAQDALKRATDASESATMASEMARAATEAVEEASRALAYTYGTTDLAAGSSALDTGKMYLVYE